MGFLVGLKIAKSVNLKEVAGRFEFSIFDDEHTTLSHKVIETGANFLKLVCEFDIRELR